MSGTPTGVDVVDRRRADARLSITGVPGFSVFDLVATPHIVVRDTFAVRRSVQGLVLVFLVISGMTAVEQAGRSITAFPGDIVVIFMDVPYRIARQAGSTKGSRLSASNFPPEIRDRTPLLLSPRFSSLAPLVASHLEWRPDSHHAFMSLGDLIKDQFVALLVRGLNMASLPSVAASRLSEAARTLIDAEIANPNLSAKLLCARLGVSRTSLFEALTADGETLGNLIRERRLAGCREEMMRATGSETIAAIAERWGFRDPSTFTRAFRRRFGEPPSQWSRALRDAGDPMGADER